MYTYPSMRKLPSHIDYLLKHEFLAKFIIHYRRNNVRYNKVSTLVVKQAFDWSMFIYKSGPL